MTGYREALSDAVRTGSNLKLKDALWTDQAEQSGMCFQWVEINQICRGAYQRPVSQVRIRRIMKAGGFKWDLMMPVILNVRDDEDGSFYLIDGGHRVELARIAEIEWVPAMIHVGMTYEEEARTYREINIGQVPAKAMEQFRSRIEENDQSACLIYDMLRYLGFDLEFVSGSARRDPRVLKSVVEVERVYDMGGQELLKNTLQMILSAWDITLPGATTGPIIGGVSLFLHLHANTDRITHATLRGLQDVTPSRIIAESRELAAIGGMGGPAARVYNRIVYHVNRHLRNGKIEPLTHTQMIRIRDHAILTSSEVARIRSLADEGMRVTDIAAVTRASISTVSQILRGRTYKGFGS